MQDHCEYRLIHGIPFAFYRFADSAWVDRMREICLAAEPAILELPIASAWKNDAESGNIGYTGTTARYHAYNVLLMRHTEVIHLFRAIQNAYFKIAMQLGLDQKPVWVQCWQNVIRTEQSLHPHSHPYEMHGHLTIQADGTQTVYVFDDGRELQFDNQPGMLTLIGNGGLTHYTTPNKSNQPRISIAFDLCRGADMSDEALALQKFIPLL